MRAFKLRINRSSLPRRFPDSWYGASGSYDLTSLRPTRKFCRLKRSPKNQSNTFRRADDLSAPLFISAAFNSTDSRCYHLSSQPGGDTQCVGPTVEKAPTSKIAAMNPAAVVVALDLAAFTSASEA